MTESPQDALVRIQASCDTRTQYLNLRMSEEAGPSYRISGAALDRVTLSTAMEQLASAVPGVAVDTSEVTLLAAQATRTAVGVNLTGLFAQPSWLAEQISQLLNGWPLDILFEEGKWAFARQTDGYLGWAYRPYLAEPANCACSHLVGAPEIRVMAEPGESAAPVTRLPGGTAVTVDGSRGEWRHLALAGGPCGWAPAASLRAFSALPDGEAARRAQMMADATQFVGVPYLWGGCTAWGIDCSGFAQLIHRLAGITLPRDADMQFNAGKPVDYPHKPGDLLFFSETGDIRRITHVAISRGGWDIIHSSRRINGVYEDNVQAVEGLRDTFVGARTFVG